MKRDLMPQRSSFLRLSLGISPLIATTVLLTAQNSWMLTLPARADKTAATGGAICAVPGQDGSPTLNSGSVNAYFPGSAAASAGSTSISVSTARGTPAIKPGDLLLVVQMQGADINSTNTDSYGDGDSTNNGTAGLSTNPASGTVNGNLANGNFTAGNFEYVVATNSVPLAGGTISISSPLVNSYSNTNFGTQGQRRFQVVRVPQYANLTVSGTISALPWDGSTGGVVSIDVAGTTTFSGSGQINVDGQGFRGGGGRVLGGGAGANTDIVTLATNNANASKAEGTAGTPRYLVDTATGTLVDNTQEGYPSGSYGRGAPGNAGGGGTDARPTANDENTGGGGGSNGGFGGRGGRSWNTALPYGGAGGAPFSVASASRLVLGGGGGAGTTNNATGTPGNGLASSGAPGGGMVFLRTGRVTGTGTISANGTTPTYVPANDGSGGGGAGGSVLVISQNGSTAGLTVNARGGNGGSNTGGGAAHGPGGGGGGGVIYATPGLTASALTGGSPGTTLNDSTNFGGATAGNGLAGTISAAPVDATTSISGAGCTINATKTTSTPGPLVAPGTATYTIVASNPVGADRPTAQNVVIADAGLPSGFTYTATPITPVYGGGATGAATVTSTGTVTAPSWSGFTIPPGGSVSLTFTVNIAAGTTPKKYDNSATANAQYTNASANVTTVAPTASPVQSTYDGTIAGNTAEDVTIGVASPLQVTKTSAVVGDNDKSNSITPGDTLEYTIVVKNASTTTAVNNVVLSDPIPANSTYVPGSLQIDALGKTDAASDDQAEFSPSQVIFRLGTGASAATGGTLAANASTTVKFRVTISDPLPSGITTLSNQASVASSGFANTPSDDPSTPAVSDPTVTKVGPRLRLVKRITGIKKNGSATVTSIGGYNQIAADVNDKASTWPGGANAYLLGAINGSQVPTPTPGAPAPQDEIEYTIYFLADGALNASSVNLCDFVPANQTLVPGTIQLSFNGATTAIVEGSGTGPGSGFYTSAFPADCTGTNNNRGAVRLQIGTVTTVTNTAASSYGFFRFRAKVN